MELKTYKDRVRDVLRQHPNARNNDGTLYACYIYRFHRKLVTEAKNGDPALSLADFKHLPPMENIRRCRQIIQNEDGEYIPTDPEVKKARKIKEKNWREVEVREAKSV